VVGPGEPGHWPCASGSHAEERLLSGRRAGRSELQSALQIFAEFVRGSRKLQALGPCVTVFGSARFDEEHRYYQLAKEIGKRIAREGYTVITGGGPGIMEAANRGAFDAGAPTAGFNITLPEEQAPNPYITPDLCVQLPLLRHPQDALPDAGEGTDGVPRRLRHDGRVVRDS